ncbi:MAG: hypothetical protein KGH69_03225 [Candidatus Micrarchaeota archaeon]|nr:hypothetical protein [Candidatus Micrarchaeota archaeon]
MNRIHGYILFLMGLAAIGYTFYLGYQLYSTISPSSLSGGVYGPITYSVKLLVLFFLMSIGYKLCDMGMRIANGGEAIQKKADRSY